MNDSRPIVCYALRIHDDDVKQRFYATVGAAQRAAQRSAGAELDWRQFGELLSAGSGYWRIVPVRIEPDESPPAFDGHRNVARVP